MIQQQCYTRERRGLFRNAEGYDSVAKSRGLDDAFIKDAIHPFCVYSASKSLQMANTPVEQYPKALTVIHYPDGQMLLGQTVYLAADFTGQRSTFFSHNYVLPETDLSDMVSCLTETAFMTGYDIEQGKELPELDQLPRTESPIDLSADAKEMLLQLGVDRAGFERVITCLMRSVAGTKKTFIIPPVETPDITRYALSWLTVLYRYLPPAFTKRLGFVTYSREPDNKKGLHLLFLEKGVVRIGDPRVSRDFLLDFAHQAYSKIEESSTDFIPFVWERIERGRDMASFYAFADAFTEDLSLSHWDKLTVMYRVYTDINRFNTFGEKDKINLLQIVKQYLPLMKSTTPEEASAARRVELSTFAARLILNEAVAITDTDYTSARGIMEEIAGYRQWDMPEKLVSHTLYRYALKNEADRYFTTDLIRHTGIDFLQEYVSLLFDKKAVYLLEGYFDERIAGLPLHALFDEMRFWLAHIPDVFFSPAFKERVCARVTTVMQAAQDGATTANLTYQTLKIFRAECMTTGLDARVDMFILAVMRAVDDGLVPRLQVDQLTRQQLAALPTAFIQRGMNSLDPVLFTMMDILKKTSASLDDDNAAPINVRYFVGSYHLDTSTFNRIILRLREFYRAYIVPPQFDNVVFLFRNVPKPGLDADALLRYVDENGGDVKGAFIKWAVEAHVFNGHNPVHKDAVRLFIKNNIKNAAFKETIYVNADLKMLAREVRFGRLAGML